VRTKKQLLAGEWAVLALLCERPAHGYAIAAAMAPGGEIGKVWSLGNALTYRALNVLRQLELVEVDAITPGDRAPSRRRLKATAAGKRMVTRWLKTPDDHVRDLRSSLILKLSFLQRHGRPTQPLLSAQRDVLAATVAVFEARIAAAPDDPEALLLRWRWTMATAALRFVEAELS
jgi:DNA-binding PadR family transcriptional regulator